MTKLHGIYLAIVGALVIGLVGAGIAYKIRTVRAEEQQAASDKVIAAKDQAIAERDKAAVQRDKDFDAFKIEMLNRIANINTQGQAVKILQPVVQGPALPQISGSDVAAEVLKGIQGDPNTKYTLFTDEQVKSQARQVLNCQLTEAGLTKCQQDAQDAEKTRNDMQAKIDSLTKSNLEWQKAGKVGPWMVGLGAAKNANGKGYTPTMLFGRRVGNKLGIMGGVQGRGDLSLWATWNFSGK